MLDEPTNDLDLETLELLEELLIEYPGTLLLVSHDRAFLDNVVTSTLVFEGEDACRSTSADTRIGCATRSAGFGKRRRARAAPRRAPAVERARSRAPKLSFKEARELAHAPARIEALEREQAALARA